MVSLGRAVQSDSGLVNSQSVLQTRFFMVESLQIVRGVDYTHFHLGPSQFVGYPFFEFFAHLQSLSYDLMTSGARVSNFGRQGVRGPSSSLVKSLKDKFDSFICYSVRSEVTTTLVLDIKISGSEFSNQTAHIGFTEGILAQRFHQLTMDSGGCVVTEK